MPAPSEERRRERADERRAQILGAALEVFAAKGYHAAGIADIAAELGLGHGTFYRYFENKLNIFAALLDQITDDITAVVRDEPANAPDLASYRAQLDRIVFRLFVALGGDPRRAKVVFFEAWSVDATMRAKVVAMLSTFAGYTEGYLTHGVERGYLREGLDTEAVARLLNAMIFEGLRGAVFSADPLDEALRAARSGVELMLHGVARSPIPT